MLNTHLLFTDDYTLTESEYDLSQEAHVSTMMTTGNGYIGVRGSLEEYGSLGIQGCYIRGVLDTVVDIKLPFCDNMYMKKQYIDEDKLKEFESQECIVNFIDFLMIRFEIDGETFFPWDGKLISWERALHLDTGCLSREVVWESSKGDITKFVFERFSSMADDHVYCIKAQATPINHNKKITIISGFDLRTKTNGQHIQQHVMSYINNHTMVHENLSGKTYGFRILTGARNDFYSSCNVKAEYQEIDNKNFLAESISFNSVSNQTYTIEKKIYVITSRDTDKDIKAILNSNLKQFATKNYDTILKESVREFQKQFQNIDIVIKGDQNADRSVRFCGYHTLISIARNDSVHSLAAKGLTGEHYNNFVWWDAEVYQTPIFIQTMPQVVKNVILYRYRLLDVAKENARLEGHKGARYPFTSGVTGKETIVKYARHPFMQIHIVSDVALNILNYYKCTGDEDLLINYGMEILLEICRYWQSRVEFNHEKSRFEICVVTGTDEHHPYVNNNAYTNYSVHKVLTETIKLYHGFKAKLTAMLNKIQFEDSEIEEFSKVANLLYLPIDKITGMIPQFDNYFSLRRDLEIQGGKAAKSFQMKQSGLYNNSQVIKQPDVMLLFSHMDMSFNHSVYSRNWNYYEARCELSSSLSYPVHAICAADMDQPESAYKYIMKTARLDLDDEHDCAAEGIHSACAAGAWLAIARGLAGMKMEENGIKFTPHFIPWWESVSFKAIWRGNRYTVTLNNKALSISCDEANQSSISLAVFNHNKELKAGETATFELSCEA